MTLKPSMVTPAAMKNLRARKGKQEPVKCMVIDCKNDSQWRAIHEEAINGVVLRRRPIRALESFLDQALRSSLPGHSFKCSQSRLRSELENYFGDCAPEDEMRRKFMINDIASWTRVLIQQTRSRDFLFRINTELPSDYQSGPEGLKMILVYRGCEVTFRQPKDKDARSFAPLGTALFKGEGYGVPVEWKADVAQDNCFYLTIEPFQRGMTI